MIGKWAKSVFSISLGLRVETKIGELLAVLQGAWEPLLFYMTESLSILLSQNKPEKHIYFTVPNF